MDFTNILFTDLLYNDMEIDLLLSIYGASKKTINKDDKPHRFIFNKE